MPLDVLLVTLTAMGNPNRTGHGRLGFRSNSYWQAQTSPKTEYSQQRLLILRALFMGPIGSCVL